MSTPLERGSTVIHCALCIQAGRATEATHQTRDLLCGCDQHIQELEQHGLAALRRHRNMTNFTITGEYPHYTITAAGNRDDRHYYVTFTLEDRSVALTPDEARDFAGWLVEAAYQADARMPDDVLAELYADEW